MKMPSLLKRTVLTGCAALGVTLVVEAAFARGGRMQLSREPAILGTTVEPCPQDPELTCLHLAGVKLHDGTEPTVMVDDMALEIHLLKGPGTNVFAVLPETVGAGVHVLEVTNAHGTATQEVSLPGTGAAAIPGYTTVSASAEFDQGIGNARANCPQGGVVVGGGYLYTVASAIASINMPFGGSGWQVVALAPPNSPAGTLTVYAICLDPAAFK